MHLLLVAMPLATSSNALSYHSSDALSYYSSVALATSSNALSY